MGFLCRDKYTSTMDDLGLVMVQRDTLSEGDAVPLMMFTSESMAF